MKIVNEKIEGLTLVDHMLRIHIDFEYLMQRLRDYISRMFRFLSFLIKARFADTSLNTQSCIKLPFFFFAFITKFRKNYFKLYK